MTNKIFTPSLGWKASLAVVAMLGSLAINCQLPDITSDNTPATGSTVNYAILINSGAVPANNYVGLEITLSTDSTFTTTNQIYQTPAASTIQNAGANFVMPAGFTATVAPGTYYVRVRVYSNTTQATVFSGTVVAVSNLNTPPQITVANNTSTTITVPLNWSPTAVGAGAVTVQGQNAVVFWVGGALSLSANGQLDNSLNDGGLSAITITVLDNTGTITYGTLAGNIASGVFYGQIIAPTGTASIDLHVAVTGSAVNYNTWNAGAGNGIAVVNAGTYTFDIISG